MLTKLKQYWTDFRLAIIAAAFAVIYFIGKKKGKENEKTRQDKKVLENLGNADKNRRRLADSDVRDRLRKKYSRK